jgi:uncharacterized membrane protein YdbT with pleckstrin-like domain
MNPDQPQTPTDYGQPVAYDKNGNPLYAHPPVQPTNTSSPAPVTPQVVQMMRAADPAPPHMSDEVIAKHNEAKAKYPMLNLSEGEYIINEVQRHPIGLIPPILVSLFLIFAVIAGVFAYPSLVKETGANAVSFESLLIPAILMIVLVLLGGYIAIYVYLSNKFYLTNESVVQEIQTSLFAHREQTVSLSNIEDASYRQNGILQALFDYGSIRLSTEGDETTYRFYYVSNPKKQIAVLNNAVEAFKNGRPVTGD